MTHITDSRVIGNHADMGGPPLAVIRNFLTVPEILRAGVRRRTASSELASAESMWDSEGGAAQPDATDGEGGSTPAVPRGSPQTPTRLGR